MKRYFTFIFFLVMSSPIWGQVSGFVYDENKTALPSCNVLLLPDSVLTLTDEAGRFTFSRLQDGDYNLIASYVGYNSDTTSIKVKNGSSIILNIRLQPSTTYLQSIEVTEEHAKQEETLQAEHIHEDFFKKNLEGSFAKSIEKLPGISAINVGVGIAKPVIRGLSSNRIIVNHQGIKQESQQWGSDHGLEIDQFDVERVEIIKGPGSLQYGSDGDARRGDGHYQYESFPLDFDLCLSNDSQEKLVIDTAHNASIEIDTDSFYE